MKDKKEVKEEVEEKTVKKGKIFGDPVAEIQW